MTLFRYSADRWPVTIIVLVSCLDMVVYFAVNNTGLLASYWLVLALPKGVICAWGHHHQHLNTFRRVWLNRGYEFLLALHTGACTNLWVLHHNLGHHQNFLDQSKDESAWKRKDGTTMHVIAYTLVVAGTSYLRAHRVGRKYPKHLGAFVTWTALTCASVAALTVWRPAPALFVFVLPMIVSLLFTAWVTYDHHAGLDTDNHFEASYNIDNRLFNLVTGNLGYHTAHHYRQGTHWSLLPQLNESIAAHIPAHLYVRSTFDVLLPSARPPATKT